MNIQTMLKVLTKYRDYFKSINASKIGYPKHLLIQTDEQVFDHCYEMLDKIEEFIQRGRLEKAHRWIGFIQGCLWDRSVYTLNELRNDNIDS
jgi:hypothetical protein